MKNLNICVPYILGSLTAVSISAQIAYKKGIKTGAVIGYEEGIKEACDVANEELEKVEKIVQNIIKNHEEES